MTQFSEGSGGRERHNTSPYSGSHSLVERLSSKPRLRQFHVLLCLVVQLCEAWMELLADVESYVQIVPKAERYLALRQAQLPGICVSVPVGP